MLSWVLKLRILLFEECPLLFPDFEAGHFYKDFLAKCEIFQLGIELCADLPDPPHMNKDQFCGPNGQIKTSVRQYFDQVSAHAVTKLEVHSKNPKMEEMH